MLRLTTVAGLLFFQLISLHTWANSARLAPTLEEQAKIKNRHPDAEVLYALESASFERDGSWKHVNYYSVRINSLEAARDYGRIVIPFDHYYSNMELDFANSRSRDGKIAPVSEDAVQHRITGGGQDFYSDSSELVFSLPNVVEGSIIEFQYTKTSKNLAFPDLHSDSSTPWYFQRKIGGDGWRGDFVHNYQYELSAPENKTLNFKYFNGYPEKKKSRKEMGKIIYSWSWRNVEPFHTELWMPPFYKVAPMMKVSTHRDWSAVDAWTWEKVADKLSPTPELNNIVKRFKLAPNATREQKIRAVYAYMQDNIRYVFAHLGRGGYEPHFPNEVIKSNYGDCKDQTVLTIALLRMLGIDALPALVETPSNGDSDAELVNLMFDHMIVYIPKTSKEPAMYIDTTGDRVLYPGVSNYLENQNTLIVDGKGGTMTRLQHEFSPSFAHLTINYQSDEDKRTLAQVEIALSGIFEQNTRSWWTNSNEKETNLTNFVKGMYSSALDYELETQLINAEDIWKPVKILAKFKFKELDDEQITRAANFNQLNYLFGSGGNLPLPENRKLNFFDDTSYRLYMTVNFLAGKNSLPVVHSQGEEIRLPWFRLLQEGMEIENGYRVEMEFYKPKLNLSVSDYKKYYEDINRLGSNESWTVGFELKDGYSVDLAETRIKFGEESVEYQIALAEHNIERGDFENALAPAEQAVILNAKNGKAWYVLAVARGFNSQIDESQQAFAKARELGYSPW